MGRGLELESFAVHEMQECSGKTMLILLAVILMGTLNLSLILTSTLTETTALKLIGA